MRLVQDSKKQDKEIKVMATIESAPLQVSKQNLHEVEISIVGTSELIVHKFSAKAIKQIEDIQAKKTKTKVKRNPKAEYEDCFYRWAEGDMDAEKGDHVWDGKTTGIPAIALKKAMVGACRQVDMPMTLARQAFHVKGQVLKVENSKPFMRTDHVRIGNKQTDVRYRPSYPQGWTVNVPIVYDADVVSLEQLVNLIGRAGFSVGLCEHRPEKDGDKGTFTVDSSKTLEDKVI